MANITELASLKTNYEALVQNSTLLVLTPDNCGIDALATFLKSVPDKQFAIDAVSIVLNVAQDQLTVSGNLNAFWTVLGWGTKGINLNKTSLVFSKPTSEIKFDLNLDGTVNIEGQDIPLKGKNVEGGLLNFTLTEDSDLKASLTSIASFVSHNRLDTYLPIGVDLFDTVPLTKLEFSFGFSRLAESRSLFTSDIGLDWPIIENKIVLEKVGLTLHSSAQFSKGGNLLESFGGNIHATLMLGVEFEVRLALNGQDNWVVEIIPKDGNILPGITGLAEFVGGSELKQIVETGLDSAGLGAVSLDYVGIGVDITNKRIKNAMINGHLTFYDLTFFVTSQLPGFDFFGRLSPLTPIHLKAFLGKFFTGAEAFPEIDITRLDIGIMPKLDSFNLIATIESNWAMPVGEVEIAFRKFSFEINKVGRVATGSITGKFNFLGADFVVGAEHPDADAGWLFYANSVSEEPIKFGELIKTIGDKFGTSKILPEFLTKLEFQQLQVSFNTVTKDFLFLIDAKFPIQGKEVDALLSIEITHNDGRYTRKISGIIKVGDLEFDLIFQQEQDADTVFLAAFENKAGKDESMGHLLASITDDQDIINIANSLNFSLKDALLVIDKPAAPATTKILFGLDIGGGLDLSNLPLVGKMLPESATVRMTFQPLVANDDFAGTSLDKVRSLVPSGGFQLPKEVKKGLGFNMQLTVGAQLFPISLPIGADDVKNQPSTASTAPSTSPSTPAAAAVPPASTADVKWFAIQKQLGPINFGRVGVQFKDKQLYFLLDASLELAGLTISLDGLFVSSTLKPIAPKFGLHGLGVDYKKGPLEIGGAFLRQTSKDDQGNTYDTYDGMAIIRTGEFALAAMGSYSYYQGHPSLFIYAYLDMPLGGPAFFFVTGLAAGFGYNRRVVMPSIDGVASFPLVAEVMSGVPGSKNDLGAEIRKLHEVIPPAVGEYFFAVGIRFSSFKIIDSFVLLAVSFGQEFEVDVLGLSTLVIPTPEEGSLAEPLAEVQLALQAVFNPDKGYLKVQAALTAASFILSRDCHLTGGFAFFTWFKDNPAEGASAGDFVLTIGGYHPLFKPPAHYPKVAPLGFNWQVIPELVLKGDFYFALVPSAVMAGGHLSATWQSGGLKAWFRLGVDFIISWKPYFYDASMYLDFGVSYTFELFGTHTISLELGADLHIWGPEFSGRAKLHIWIFTVGVRFGAGNSDEPPALTWDEFREGFLPDNSKWESVSVTQGLVNQLGTDDDPLYIVNPKDFILETTSALPINASNIALSGSNLGIQIGSMKITDSLTSTHNITISRGGQKVTGEFIFSPIKKQVPGALWADNSKHSKRETDRERLDREKRFVENACTGFSVKGKPAEPSDQTHKVGIENLLNEQEDFLPKILFGNGANLSNDWLKTAGGRQKVADKIESVFAERNELLRALGFHETYQPNRELADEFLIASTI